MHCMSFKITHLKRLVLCIVYRMEIDSTFIKITKGFHKKGPIIFKNGGELSLKQGASHLEKNGGELSAGASCLEIVDTSSGGQWSSSPVYLFTLTPKFIHNHHSYPDSKTL